MAEDREGSGRTARYVADLLIEPFAPLGAVERQRARLLATLLLCVVALGLLSALIQAATVPNFHETLVSVLLAVLVLCVAYVGSRTKLYRVSAAVAAVTPMLACIAVGVRSPDDRVWYAFILIAVILATLFFSVRTASLVALAIFVTLCLLPIWVLELRSPVRIVPLLALHGVLLPLLLIAARHQAAIERESQIELRRMDARIAELDRLETLGRVSRRVAHDVNNLIMVIDSSVTLIERKPSALNEDEVKGIRMALERAAALSREILASPEHAASRTRIFDVQGLLHDFQPLLARLAGPSIRVVVRPSPALPLVEMDSLRLEQVLMNLVGNARDAMPDGGDLVIECNRAVLDETYIAEHPGARPGEHVVVSVIDTGVGMDATTLERSFEPFFSTKPAGRGAGLGLAIVRDSVAESGGHVTVSSVPGRGSTFRAYLPVRSSA